ncbi:MAG: hypothetical protein JXA30_18465 [Deltaproteobacteria bacterium]|nr:hypothetical protein [Deltaproteobacteria bacterium]
MSAKPSAFRIASKQALDSLRSTTGKVASNGKVNRIALDVSLNGEDEIVSVRMHDSKLNWSCTCGRQNCGHIATALSWISAEETAESNPPQRAIQSPVSKSRISMSDHFAESELVVGTTMKGLSNALEDLITSVVRIGTDAGEGLSVDESIQRLIEVAPSPLPLGISRWIGRLKTALNRHDSDLVARLLHGAARLSEDLRGSATDDDRNQRIVSWMGALSRDSKEILRISERNLLEIAREWLNGIERSAIERRYLIDLESGEVYREERARGTQTASFGPCPRLINAGLLVVEQGIPPRRVHLLQYSISALISAEAESQLLSWGNRRFDLLAERYKKTQKLSPGLSEPFVLIAPSDIDLQRGCLLIDETDRPLPIATADDPSLIRFVESIPNIKRAALVAGRLVDAQGTLMLRPLSICQLKDGRCNYLRI